MWHLWGKSDMPRRFGWENLKGKDYLKNLGVDGSKIKWLLVAQKKAWSGFIWFKVGTNSGLFCVWQ